MQASVLIVDDQEIGRITLEGLLLPEGYTLYFAASGEEALGMLDDIRPDVILLDVMMPAMDGFQVCHHIRNNPHWRDIPVILVTALNDRKSKIKGLEAGADDFLSKPVDLAELRARVRTTINLGRTRRQLQERARFEWAVTHSSDGFAWLDKEGRLLGANPAAKAWLGTESNEEEPWLETLMSKFLLQPPRTWADIAKQRQTTELTLIRPETEQVQPLWLKVKLSPMPIIEKKPEGWLVHVQDVTPLEMHMLQVASVIGFLSHKLNSPLATVKAALEMLETTIQNDESNQRFLQIAERSVISLERSIERLLHFAEDFRSPLAKDSSDSASTLEHILAQICRQHSLEAEQCTYTDDLTRTPILPPAVIKGILYQLIDNAIKFHPTHHPRIQVTLQDEGQDRMCIMVEDDGTGIPAERRHQVWRPLYQIDREGAGQTQGMGIGLSLVANTVWRVGGRCWIEESESGGARVCISIPALPPSSSAPNH